MATEPYRPLPASAPPRGRTGEDLAARFLERQGLRILERNLRSRLGEIDLVARDGATLVFVEVKTRRPGAADPPQASVDGRKQRRLARLALNYLARRGLGDLGCRFDVVAVTVGPDGRAPVVEHFRGAFLADPWSA
ncbi:MAG: YraN family protein [Candidatus Rokuibacteriota bacterium]